MRIMIITKTIMDDTIMNDVNDDENSLFNNSVFSGNLCNADNEINKMNILKDLIITLNESITELKEEIVFLKSESEKSIMIQKLIDIVKIHASNKGITNISDNHSNESQCNVVLSADSTACSSKRLHTNGNITLFDELNCTDYTSHNKVNMSSILDELICSPVNKINSENSENKLHYFPCIENDADAENSLYSDISDDSEFHSIRSKEDETHNRQIANYRFKEHWSYLNRNRDTNNAGGVIDTNIEKERVDATVTEKERKIKAALERLAVAAPVNNFIPHIKARTTFITRGSALSVSKPCKIIFSRRSTSSPNFSFTSRFMNDFCAHLSKITLTVSLLPLDFENISAWAV